MSPGQRINDKEKRLQRDGRTWPSGAGGKHTSLGNAEGEEKILVWLEPRSCPCTTQEIKADIKPKFKAKIFTRNGYGGVPGYISVLGKCQDKSEKRAKIYNGVASGNESSVDLTIGAQPSLTVPINYEDKDHKFFAALFVGGWIFR